MVIEISPTLLYGVIVAIIAFTVSLAAFIWNIFDFQRTKVLEPISNLINIQTAFSKEVAEIKLAVQTIQEEFKTRLTIKDGTPIEVVIEKMSEQFDLMVDRDLCNFYLDSQPKFECDRNGLCIRVNEEWLVQTGISESRAIGNGWLHIIHPTDKKRVMYAWEDFIQKNMPFDCEYRIVSDKHSEGMRVRAKAVAKRDGDSIKLIIGTVQPLKQNRQYEAAHHS